MKCQFHQEEILFLGFVVSSKGISMKAKQIEVVRKWLEPKSLQNIQVFLDFANFYCQLIKGFSKIAAPLTSMLKTTMSLHMLVANEVQGTKVLAVNEASDIGGDDGSSNRLKCVEMKT